MEWSGVGYLEESAVLHCIAVTNEVRSGQVIPLGVREGINKTMFTSFIPSKLLD